MTARREITLPVETIVEALCTRAWAVDERLAATRTLLAMTARPAQPDTGPTKMRRDLLSKYYRQELTSRGATISRAVAHKARNCKINLVGYIDGVFQPEQQLVLILDDGGTPQKHAMSVATYYKAALLMFVSGHASALVHRPADGKRFKINRLDMTDALREKIHELIRRAVDVILDHPETDEVRLHRIADAIVVREVVVRLTGPAQTVDLLELFEKQTSHEEWLSYQ